MAGAVGFIEMGDEILVPYNLYNFVLDGDAYDLSLGPVAPLPSRGTKASLYSCGFHLVGPFGEWMTSDEGFPAFPFGPVPKTADDHGGSLCGDWFSFVGVGADGSFTSVTQLYYGSGPGSFQFYGEWDFRPGDGLFELFLSNEYSPPSVYADMFITSPPSGTFALGISINPSTGEAIGFINDEEVAVVTGVSGSCSGWPSSGDMGYVLTDYDGNTPLPSGVAQMRGMLTAADMQYWMDYDWATHTGFA
jgi:hypothetical protein